MVSVVTHMRFITTYRAADTTDLDSDGHAVILERLKLVLGELEVLGRVSQLRGPIRPSVHILVIVVD
jgi:hypothetical protein